MKGKAVDRASEGNVDVLVRVTVDEVEAEKALDDAVDDAVDIDAVDTEFDRREGVGRDLIREDPANVKQHSEGLLNEDSAVGRVSSRRS